MTLILACGARPREAPPIKKVTRKRRKDVFYIQICIVMFPNDLEKKLKRSRRRNERGNEEEIIKGCKKLYPV